jgi:hypothetical protein
VPIGKGAYVAATPGSPIVEKITRAIETIPDGPSRRAAESLINGGELTTGSSRGDVSDVTRKGTVDDSLKSFDDAVREAGGKPADVTIPPGYQGNLRYYIAQDGTTFVHRTFSTRGSPTAEIQVVEPPRPGILHYIKVRFAE